MGFKLKETRIAILGAILLAFCVGIGHANDHYCGMHCVYACADILDRGSVIEFEKLLTVEYVDSRKGSSVTAVIKALNAFQLKGTFFSNLSLFDLPLSGSPMILHVRSSMVSPSYDHWIVYLGETKDQLIRVIDPNVGLTEISVAELGCRWDGAGILASTTDWESTSFKIFAWMGRAFYVLLSIAFAVLFWRGASRRIGSDFVQFRAAIAIVFVFLSGTIGVAIDLSRNRLILDRAATGFLIASHKASNYETISYETLLVEIENNGRRSQLGQVDLLAN